MSIELRKKWLSTAIRIAEPIVSHAAQQNLHRQLPNVFGAGGADRPATGPLEAVCRTLSGLAPWMACSTANESETGRQRQLIDHAQAGPRGNLRPIIT